MISQILATWIVVVASAASPTMPELPSSLSYSTIRAIPMQHDGRWPPLDTIARDLINEVTGTEFFQGHDPVALLLAWSFNVQAWQQAPLISISNAELRQELKLSPTQTMYSFAELTAHRYLHALVDELSNRPEGSKPNPLESKVQDIHGRLLTLHGIFTGQTLRMIPEEKDPLGAWKTLPQASAMGGPSSNPVAVTWAQLGTVFNENNAPAFAKAAHTLASQLKSQPAAFRPSSSLIETELRYNQLNPYNTAWKVMIVAALLSLASLYIKKRWFDYIAILGMIAGFAILTYGLSLRWQIAGRIPASNMFESLLFLSWGMGAFAILSMFVVRDRVVPLTASAMGAVALMLADILPMNHFIRPIAPVLLDTVWMSIHVPIIMVSYSVLALGVVVAHAQLFAMAFAPKKHAVHEKIDSLHYWYIHVGSILLLAGIVTGSMWAASSWGRYWGWDPKEVWSLVALLGYLTILHVRTNKDKTPLWMYVVGGLMTLVVLALVVPQLAPLTSGKILALGGAVIGMIVFVFAHGSFATAMKSILCFWLIIMTYVGVNYVLGIGLHSYGFGTGAIAKYMFLTGGFDLGIMVFCTAIYLLRTRSMKPATKSTPLPVVS